MTRELPMDHGSSVCGSGVPKPEEEEEEEEDNDDDASDNRMDKEEEEEVNDNNKLEEEDEDAKDKYVVWCIGAWVRIRIKDQDRG